MAAHVGTRRSDQTRSHAQKFFRKLESDNQRQMPKNQELFE